MRTATIQDISANTAQFEQWLNSGEQVKLMREGRAFAVVSPLPKKTTSLANPPPPTSVGKILKPWTTRAELLEDFFDRGE